MPLTVRCPKCSKELAAPDELIGKVAACPRCNTQFPVTVSVRASAPSLLAAPPATPTSESTAPATLEAPVANASVPSNLPPTPVKRFRSGTTKPPSNTAPPAEPRTAETRPADSRAAEPRAAGIPELRTPPATETRTSSVSPAPLSREASTAKFIAASTTETRVNLGADGRLPELALQEGAQKEAEESTEQASNPLLVIVVLAISFISVAVILLWDTEARRAESRTRAAAREQLVEHYTNPPHPLHPLEEYQQLLRKALQAYNQGKYADEQRYYRQVLNMLRDERLLKDETAVTGLTGVRKGPNPPSDEHLESVLARLLSDD